LKGAVGSQQAGERPWLVLSNNMNNTYSPMINAIPFTAKNKKSIPVHVPVHAGEVEGIYKDSILEIEQITSVNKVDFTKKIGYASEDLQYRIFTCMLIQMPFMERCMRKKNRMEVSNFERQGAVV
jgi:mRNA interferase MazF